MYLNNKLKFFHQLFIFENSKIYTKEFILTVCEFSQQLTLLAPDDVAVNNEI